MIAVCFKIVYMSLAVLYLFRFCMIIVSPINWLCYMFLNVKVKNIAFDSHTQKIITNARFSTYIIM